MFVSKKEAPASRISQSSLMTGTDLSALLSATSDQYHMSLADMNEANPCLLVFLRTLGCCFCRESLQDLKAALPLLEQEKVKAVLVHMSSEEDASQTLALYGLADLSRVSDPQRKLYGYFGLLRGQLEDFLSAKTFARALSALMQGNAISASSGDPLQMHGAFLIHRGRLVSDFKAERLDSRPDFAGIARLKAAVLS